MNTKNNKAFFEENGVVALKADKGKIPEAVEMKLAELGNPLQAIPFYAIYGPAIEEPIKLSGPITPGQVAEAIRRAAGNAETRELASKLGNL